MRPSKTDAKFNVACNLIFNTFKHSVLVVAFVCSSICIPMLAVADSDLPLVTGQVKKVKPDSGKITIKHDPIPNLDMPGMTMVFRTENDVDISDLKKGDDVSFTVIEKDGKMVILSIEKTE